MEHLESRHVSFVFPMRTFQFVALRGPNRWSHLPILEVHDAAVTSPEPSHSICIVAKLLGDFLDAKQFTTSHPLSVENARRITDSLPSYHTDSELWLACARWFSAMAGVPTFELESSIERRSTDSILDGNSHTVTVLAMEMEEQSLSEKCFLMAREWLDEPNALKDFPLGQKVRELFDFADDVRLGPSSRAILRAARRRDIPYLRLNRGSLVQLGEGKRQRRIWTAETDATSAIAEAIASDKDLTKRLLRQVGVPVPRGRAVTDEQDAWIAAQEIGFPVVVKPCNANHQRGISIELNTRDEIVKAYEFAVRAGETTDILVEQFAEGHHHRLLVVGNRLVAAAKGRSECVTGDGVSTIEQLVEIVNSDPRRGEAYTDPLGTLLLSEPAIIELNKQGLTIHSVPEKERVVVVRRTGDLTTDCTEEVHPETAEQAVLAARVVGLDIAGLDILAKDIGRPLEMQRGAVVEVNAGPSLSPHVTPLYGKPQKVGDAIIEMLFPVGQPSRIKIIGIVKSKHSDTLFEQFAEQLRLRNIDFGIISHGQAGFNGRIVDTGCANDEERVAAILCNPILSALLIHLDVLQSAMRGLCSPRLDRVLFSQDSISENPSSTEIAGLKAILNAVTNGSVFGDRLPSESFHHIAKYKNSRSSAKNTLDRAFEIEI
jgi:cyanophycin synthetase